MTPRTTKTETWAQRLGHLMAAVRRKSAADAEYASANRNCVHRTLRGEGPDGPGANPASGARMVVNMPAAHVPDFCRASKRGDDKPYLNAYDLATSTRPVSDKRKQVDAALPLRSDDAPQDIYFGAVELNGCGVRFYGDITLVIRPEALDLETVVLDRNSYDLIRAPANQRVTATTPPERRQQQRSMLQSWSGRWAKDLDTMATIMLMRTLGSTGRRWTTGQISQSLCNDEDYIEVLKSGSFGTRDLQEARVGAADAAHDALIASRMSRLPLPRLEAMVWRHRRRRAEAALRAAGVPVRIVTTEGRVRG